MSLVHSAIVLRRIGATSSTRNVFASALMALIAVSGSMFTDNSVSYSFVMMPLAIVMGCSLGAGRAAASDAAASLPLLAEAVPENDQPVAGPRRPRWGSRNLPNLIDS